MKTLKNTLLVALLMTLSSALYADTASKELWLKFTGTNYCAPKFCAEAIPSAALAPAMDFYSNNQDKINNHRYMIVIDFNMNSLEKRFFLLNLKTGSVETLLVTHAKKSETSPGMAGAFSDVVGSEMSSLGFFITDSEPYYGKHGMSLKLDGVSDTNKSARERLIVLHGADYATEWFINLRGRLGFSQGCPAISPDKVEGVIKKIKGQGLLYIHKNVTDL